jgi:hypothetical protein
MGIDLPDLLDLEIDLDLDNFEALTSIPKIVKKEKKTSDKAGRGRKQCPSCNIFIGVRTLTCECGFSFAGAEKKDLPPQAKKPEVREIKVATEPSRGRKMCFGCKMFVGVRTTLCSCGFDFSIPAVSYAEPEEGEATESGEKKEAPKTYEEKLTLRKKDLDKTKSVIIAGSGYPKYELKSLDEKDIREWLALMREFSSKRKEIYSCEAIVHFAKYKYPYDKNPDLFEKIKKVYLEE